MNGRIDSRLAALGIALPEAASPQANYVPFVRTGNLVFLSGQVCIRDGAITHRGKVGREIDAAGALAAARVVGVNLLAALRLACDGDLDRVVRCVSVRGYVAVDPSFTAIPAVVNGVSDLFVEVFGDAGRHSRSAIGVAALPRDCAFEADAVFELG